MEASLQAVTIEPSDKAEASVIWMHGLGADGHDFEPIVPLLKLPPELKIRFIFPHAPIRPVTINAGMEMRAWYDIVGIGVDAEVDEAGIRASVAAVEKMIEQEMANGVPSERIVLAGFSQGGVIALHLGLRFPQRLAGIMALSTYLPLAESLASEAHAAQNGLEIFVAHGTHDPVLPEKLGRKAADHLEASGYAVQYKSYGMEHAVNPQEIADIGLWLDQRLNR